MAVTCQIKTQSKQYPVIIDRNALKGFFSLIRKNHPQSQIAIISESRIEKIYSKALKFPDRKFHSYYFPAGENSKKVETKIKIESFLFENNFNRSDVVVALGGGVVGDLVGYVAATYMRGVAYYQIPTTIISMVDSSVGGKTGINNKFGKNLIGAFNQPEAVLIDLDFIDTLPEIEFRNGLAEIIKYGFIYQPKIFKLIAKNIEKLFARDKKLLSELVLESIKVKNIVVTKDERESGFRRILNFGHTVGHAVEFLSKFKIKHGMAISIGMALEAFISFKHGILSDDDFESVLNILQLLQLPTELPKEYPLTAIFSVMEKDKKNTNQEVGITILKRIGEIESNDGKFLNTISKKEFLSLAKSYQTY